MVDQPIDFETSDNDGSTVAYSGTATTTFANVPAVADKVISGIMFNFKGANVELSLDGGTTYFVFPKDALGAKDVKGRITQLQIKTSTGSTDYELWIDFEDS